MIRIALGLLALLLVAGCTSQAEIARQQAQADMAQCEAYGFKLGTPEFSQCHIRLAELRIQQQHAAAAEMEAALGIASMYRNNWGSHQPALGTTCYPMGGGVLNCR